MKKLHYDPTEALQVKSGETPLNVLLSAGFKALLIDEEELSIFLDVHNLAFTDLKRPVSADSFLLLKHPQAYQLKQHPLARPYNTRSISLLNYRTTRLKTSSATKLHEMTARLGVKNILELGMGQGRMALEFSAMSREFHVWGVHKGDEPVDLAATASFFGITPQGQLQTEVYDLNDGELNCAGEESFELILSQGTTRYIKHKATLLESIYRRLQEGGCAYVDINLWRVRDEKNKEVKLADFFSDDKWRGVFDFDAVSSMLLIHKKNEGELKLGLTFLPEESHETVWSNSQNNVETVGWLSTYRL